ncbi:MAG: RIP metalloprotease RseP, partial [Planctomycetes bacterium]|nr:RIP metalloprotease RseP [Planctomycetota bacterium]
DVSYVPKTVQTQRARVGVTPIGRTVEGIRSSVPVVARSGILRGDLLRSVDATPFLGTPPTSAAAEMTLEITRDGHERVLQFPVSSEERAAFFDNVAFAFSDRHGVMLRPLPNSPAQTAGIHTGDIVAAIDGNEILEWQDLVDAVFDAGENPMRFQLSRDGQRVDITLAPARETVASLGFTCPLEPLTWVYRVDSFGEAVRAGCTASIDMIQQLYVTLRKIFRGDVAAKNLGGIVTISRASYHFAEQGWAVFFYFLAILSINLAVVNVLPIPVLDGGHLLFLLIEKVKGSPVSTQVMTYSQVLGLVFVIALMLFVTYNDILRLL